MARPSIINDTLIARFCFVIRVSGSIQTAIMDTGIGRESYVRWAREVRERRASKAKVKFIRAAEQAEADFKMLRERQLVCTSASTGRPWLGGLNGDIPTSMVVDDGSRWPTWMGPPSSPSPAG